MSKTSQLGTCRTSYHHPTISLPTTALLISLGKIYTSLGIFYQLFLSINQNVFRITLVRWKQREWEQFIGS